MACLITGLEVHRYAPELNKLHLRDRQMRPAPSCTITHHSETLVFTQVPNISGACCVMSHPALVLV